MKKIYAIFYLFLATNQFYAESNSLQKLQNRFEESQKDLVLIHQTLQLTQNKLHHAEKEIAKNKTEIIDLLQTIAQSARLKRWQLVATTCATIGLMIKYFPPIL